MLKTVSFTVAALKDQTVLETELATLQLEKQNILNNIDSVQEQIDQQWKNLATAHYNTQVTKYRKEQIRDYFGHKSLRGERIGKLYSGSHKTWTENDSDIQTGLAVHDKIMKKQKFSCQNNGFELPGDSKGSIYPKYREIKYNLLQPILGEHIYECGVTAVRLKSDTTREDIKAVYGYATIDEKAIFSTHDHYYYEDRFQTILNLQENQVLGRVVKEKDETYVINFDDKEITVHKSHVVVQKLDDILQKFKNPMDKEDDGFDKTKAKKNDIESFYKLKKLIGRVVSVHNVHKRVSAEKFDANIEMAHVEFINPITDQSEERFQIMVPTEILEVDWGEERFYDEYEAELKRIKAEYLSANGIGNPLTPDAKSLSSKYWSRQTRELRRLADKRTLEQKEESEKRMAEQKVESGVPRESSSNINNTTTKKQDPTQEVENEIRNLVSKRNEKRQHLLEIEMNIEAIVTELKRKEKEAEQKAYFKYIAAQQQDDLFLSYGKSKEFRGQRIYNMMTVHQTEEQRKTWDDMHDMMFPQVKPQALPKKREEHRPDKRSQNVARRSGSQDQEGQPKMELAQGSFSVKDAIRSKTPVSEKRIMFSRPAQAAAGQKSKSSRNGFWGRRQKKF